MGRVARVFAHAKNVTVDPVVGGAKFVGRKTKAGALVVAHKAQDAGHAISREEQAIEVNRAAKREAREMLEESLEEVAQEAAARATKKAQVKPTKRTTKPKARATA